MTDATAEAIPLEVLPIETRTAKRPMLNAALAGGVLRLDAFEASYDALARNNRGNWTPAATASDVRMHVRMFRDILEENDVAHFGEIGQQHVAALRQHLNIIPTRYGQSSRLRIMKPAALRAFAADEIARAERRGEAPPKVGLSAATIRKHLCNLDTFLNHVRASGYIVADWSLKSLRPRKPKAGALRLAQLKPSPDQVQPLFDLSIFTGCRDATDCHVPRNAVFHVGAYYLPMLFAYLGARRNEVCWPRNEGRARYAAWCRDSHPRQRSP